MARPSLGFVFRRAGHADGKAEAAPEAVQPPARRMAVAPSRLRRERRALLREREDRLRDLGGLALEMFRQDSFREHLLYERCAEVATLDDRLFELELLLDARRPPAARCACGAPVFWGSHFCGYCGRQVGEPLVACVHCGHALTADARYCPACAAPAPEAGEQTER